MVKYLKIDRLDNCSAHISHLFANSRDGFMLVDSTRHVLFINQPLAQMLGRRVKATQYMEVEEWMPGFGRILSQLRRHKKYEGMVTLRTDRDRYTFHAYAERIEEREIAMVLRFDDAVTKSGQIEGPLLDPLTGIPERPYILERLNETINRCRREGCKAALFFIDLDNFKTINDNFGHEVGDAVLKETVERIKGLLRESDVLARYGGDEFLLLMDSIKNDNAPMFLADRIIKSFHRPFLVNGVGYKIGCSIGIAIIPRDGERTDSVIRHADLAMYRAKEEGKSTFRFFSEDIDRNIKRRYIITRILREALKGGSFTLVFQPQFEIMKKRVVAVEALLRLKDERLGEISPAEFIPIAEESDLMVHIGRWTFEECCRHLREWDRKGNEQELNLSINISKSQLLDAQWSDFVAQTLERYGIEASRIEFEIDEKSFADGNKQVQETLRRLLEMGVAFVVDNFGTGMSSLSALKKYHFRKIKIDKTFIQHLTENNECREIVEAIIAMAKVLGIETLAEGVEESAQEELLKKLGCSEMQGYLFSYPLIAEQVLKLLKEKERSVL